MYSLGCSHQYCCSPSTKTVCFRNAVFPFLYQTSLFFPFLHSFCLFHSIPSLSLINADFCVAGCLIAYGAVLGKVSPVQLMVMTLFGITLFAVEEYIILNLIHVSQWLISLSWALRDWSSCVCHFVYFC